MWHHIASTIVTRCSDAVLTPGQVSKVCREYISRCPIFLDDLECQVSKLANSDTCPRPTTHRSHFTIISFFSTPFFVAWIPAHASEPSTISMNSTFLP